MCIFQSTEYVTTRARFNNISLSLLLTIPEVISCDSMHLRVGVHIVHALHLGMCKFTFSANLHSCMQMFMYNMEISGHIIMIGRKHEAQILLMERIV